MEHATSIIQGVRYDVRVRLSVAFDCYKYIIDMVLNMYTSYVIRLPISVVKQWYVSS